MGFEPGAAFLGAASANFAEQAGIYGLISAGASLASGNSAKAVSDQFTSFFAEEGCTLFAATSSGQNCGRNEHSRNEVPVVICRYAIALAAIGIIEAFVATRKVFTTLDMFFAILAIAALFLLLGVALSARSAGMHMEGRITIGAATLSLLALLFFHGSNVVASAIAASVCFAASAVLASSIILNRSA